MRWFFDTSHTDTSLTHSVHGRLKDTLLTTEETSKHEPASEGEMSISQVADMFGVTMRTLRFYEEKDLLKPRRIGNRRFYNAQCCARLNLVLKGKAMGLGLDAISALVTAVETKAPDEVRAQNVRALCEEQHEMLVERRRVLDSQIEETQRVLADLKQL